MSYCKTQARDYTGYWGILQAWYGTKNYSWWH